MGRKESLRGLILRRYLHGHDLYQCRTRKKVYYLRSNAFNEYFRCGLDIAVHLREGNGKSQRTYYYGGILIHRKNNWFSMLHQPTGTQESICIDLDCPKSRLKKRTRTYARLFRCSFCPHATSLWLITEKKKRDIQRIIDMIDSNKEKE